MPNSATSQTSAETRLFCLPTACDSIQNIVTSLQSPVSSQDLIAFYSFDGNASDMSGWGNHGTVNGATLTTDREEMRIRPMGLMG